MSEKTVETFQVAWPAAPPPLEESRHPPDRRADAEVAAFARLLPALLETHRGQYVAIHGGRVVNAGPEAIPLILKVHQAIGYVPIHVALVTEEPPRPVRVNIPLRPVSQ